MSSLQKKVLVVVVGVFLFILFSHAKKTFSNWNTDMQGPTTTLTASAGCSPSSATNPTTFSCSNSSATLTLQCNDLLGTSGCNALHYYSSSTLITTCNAVGNGSYTRVAGFSSSQTFLAAASDKQYFCTYSTDNAGNNELDISNKVKLYTVSFTHTVSGIVYVDNNHSHSSVGQNKFSPPNVSAYASAGGCSGVSYPVQNNADGSYVVSNLPGGTYAICNIVPLGYNPTFPTGTPPSYIVTVGVGCATSPVNPQEATACSNGNISNLNFGITNSQPWFQCNGMDCRTDSGLGFQDNIPFNTPLNYASTASPASINNMPGVIFTGKSTPGFGSGDSSSTHWVAGGTSYGETFAPIHRTSYSYLSAKIQNNDATDITSTCSTSCNLSSLSSGLYTVGSATTPADLTTITTDMTITSPKNIVILVSGNLTIKAKIIVASGATLTISTGSKISVDTNVGEIDGFYSTDTSFDAGGDMTACYTLGATPNKQLVIQGALAILGTTNSFTYSNRDLCGANLNTPSVLINGRPDFIINAPQFILYQSQIWQEIAP